MSSPQFAGNIQSGSAGHIRYLVYTMYTMNALDGLLKLSGSVSPEDAAELVKSASPGITAPHQNNGTR